MEYWPAHLREVGDYQQIAKALQPEMDALLKAFIQTRENFFLATLSERGVKRWEKILGIAALPGENLDARRERIWIQYANRIPYTWQALLQYLKGVHRDAWAKRRLDIHLVEAFVPLSELMLRSLMLRTLRNMIPANLEMRLYLEGTFTLAETLEDDAERGFADDTLTIGGFFGLSFDEA